MFLILLIKGFIIGIAFIIPGVSGGTLAIYLGVYDKLLYAITHIFKEFKKSFLYLLPIFIGLFTSIVLLAKLLGWLISFNSVITLSFFIGLLLGGIPSLYQKIKGQPISIYSILSFIIAFAAVMFLLVGKLGNISTSIDRFDFSLWTYSLIFIVGLLAAATMVVPGISGSALLITLGVYTAIVTDVVGNILDFSVLGYNLQVIIPFGFGAVIGIFLISKLIEIVLKKYVIQTYSAIIGFIVASAIVIIFEMTDQTTAIDFKDQMPIYNNLLGYMSNNIWSIIIGIIALFLGVFVAFQLVKIDRLFTHDKNQIS